MVRSLPEIATSDHVLRVTTLSIVLAVSLNPAAGLLCVMCCGPAVSVAPEAAGCHSQNTDAAPMTITAAHACDRASLDEAAIATDGVRRLFVQRPHATPVEAALRTLNADREDDRRVHRSNSSRYPATHLLSLRI